MSAEYETSEAIVAGICKGDQNAEAAMVEKYGRALLYVLEKRTGDREQARDLLQEAFLVVLEKLRSGPINEPAKLSSYLQNTAVNLFIGEIRKETRRKTTADSDLLEVIAGYEGDQFQNLIKERTEVSIRRLIEELKNDRDRRILTLFYIEDCDKDSVCQQLDLSQRHFDRVISRARTRFRELVEDRREEIPAGMTT